MNTTGNPSRAIITMYPGMGTAMERIISVHPTPAGMMAKMKRLLASRTFEMSASTLSSSCSPSTE